MENNENSDFNYVQEKIKPKNRRRIRKALAVIGLAVVSAVIFGFTARLIFVASEGTVNKLLGITPTPTPPVGQGQVTTRNEVKLGNPTKAPTLSPTPTVVPTIQTSMADATQKADPTEVITQSATSDPKENTATVTAAQIGNENVSTPTQSQVSTAETVNEPVPTPSGNSENENTSERNEVVQETETFEEGKEDENDPDGSTETGNENADSELVSQYSPLTGYIMMMSELRKVADTASLALIRVYSVTNGINWLDESVETKQELSGVLLAENGVELLVLTDYASVAASDRIDVEFADGTVTEAVLYSSDSDLGLAVLAIPLEQLPEDCQYSFIRLGDSGLLYDGEPIIAIGRPNGYYGAVEFGFVSHKGLSKYFVDGVADEFTTDVMISANGDSILIGLDGSLIGIVPMTASDLNSQKSCVIGINALKTALLKLLNGVGIPYLGVRSENIPEDVLANMGLKNGIYVNEAVSGSPAAEAGIKKGDVIVGLDGVVINTVSDYYDYLMSLELGAEVEAAIFRSSRKEEPEEKIVISVGVK